MNEQVIVNHINIKGIYKRKGVFTRPNYIVNHINIKGIYKIGETTAKVYLPSYKYKLWNFERNDFNIKNHSETLLEYNGYEFKLPINLNDNFISKFK